MIRRLFLTCNAYIKSSAKAFNVTFASNDKDYFKVICLRASAGRDFFFLMTLRVPLIHYVDISRRHSHKCVCTIMVINVQNQQFSASPNSSNVTNLAKRSEFC